MREQATITRRRFATLFASLALAAAMALAAPAAAFADGTEDTFVQATSRTATVTVGDQIDMSYTASANKQFNALFDASGWHVDYKITGTEDGGAATINKHSGILTASAAGEVTVTAYLVNAAIQSGQNTNPCMDYVYSASKTVTINPVSEDDPVYGYQGSTFQIMMTSFTPEVDSAEPDDGYYVNTLTNVAPTGDHYIFNYSQNYGIGNSGLSTYVTNNLGKVYLMRGDDVVAVLGGSGLNLVQQGTSKTNLSIRIDESLITSGSYALVFDSGYRAGNGTYALGSDVVFTFDIQEQS